MARIASQSKGGYYPTPQKEIDLILPHLTFTYSDEASHINVIDPCCGTGAALKDLKEHIKAQIVEHEIPADITSYGVELEEGRANAAKENLDHVVHEGYEMMRTEEKFGMMWLNAPYDEFQGERLELRFLRTLTSTTRNVLQKKGLLMFCIPQHVLAQTAAILAQRFTDIEIYRFTDENFYVFDQVVVFGYFGKPPEDGQAEMIEYLKEMAKADPSVIPTLAEIKETFIIQAHKEPVEIFRAGKLNIKELAIDLAASPVFEEFNQRVTSKESRAIMKRPILPLKSTHAGIAVASGAIGGNLGTHVVSGVTKQITHKEDMFDDEGRLTGEKVTKFYSSVVRAFTPNGVHELN